MYAWICDKDHVVGDDDPKISVWEEINVYGPNTATMEQMAQLKAGKGYAFRMYDDDGFVNLSGRLLGDPDTDGFGPLEDFGMGGYGCTEIRYGKHDWKVL